MAGQAAPRFPLPAPTTALSLFVLLVAAPAISFTTFVSAGAEEGEALLRFKATLYGLDADLPSWIPGPAPCNANFTTWEGVICFNGHVWGVQLENRGLVGTLEIEPLVALIGLRAISFMHNNLAGPLPDLNRLGALKAVYLSDNNFSGEIQGGAFAGMRSLKKLFISNNGFTGPIPESLVNLSKLAELRLDHNEFAGPLPEFSQPGLVTVDVSFNALEGPIPQRLSKMDPKFFQGNPKLCGAPLTVPCGDAGEKRRPTTHHGLSLAQIIAFCILFSLALIFLGLVFLLRHDETVVMGRPSSKQSKAAPADASKLEITGLSEKHHNHHRHDSRLVFLRTATERFELQELLRASAEVLGSGNFGSSFKAMLPAVPAVVVKRFREMNGVGRDDFNEHMRRLGRLSHANVLPLVAFYYRKEEKLLITHFVPNGSLAHMLHGNRGSTLPPLDFPARLKIVKGVARGLGYLYDELPVLKLPHGHLKSSNVLLDENLEPLLADYALAPVMNAAHASQVMVAYKSPEVIRLGQPSRKSDVWCFGVLILEILTGKFPANFLHKGSGSSGTDLATWVSSMMKEEGDGKEVFDSDMRSSSTAGNGQWEEMMHKLLMIGLDCCRENPDERTGMREVLERILQLNLSTSN
ncbi:eucine-rich repeat receptor-like protein kinase [Platanthera zijinensis]|uniref:Eucine-rich repeat receptor-like protein kinase n=1 Tax=Platanthera zijinensis TaxID=2320716 RepID=A0AAP0BXM2_9ASPA